MYTLYDFPELLSSYQKNGDIYYQNQRLVVSCEMDYECSKAL